MGKRGKTKKEAQRACNVGPAPDIPPEKIEEVIRVWLEKGPEKLDLGKYENKLPTSGRNVEGILENKILITLLKRINETLRFKGSQLQNALLKFIQKRELGLNQNMRFTDAQIARLKQRSISCVLYHWREIVEHRETWMKKSKGETRKMLQDMLKANDDPYGAEANSIVTAGGRRKQETAREKSPRISNPPKGAS